MHILLGHTWIPISACCLQTSIPSPSCTYAFSYSLPPFPLPIPSVHLQDTFPTNSDCCTGGAAAAPLCAHKLMLLLRTTRCCRTYLPQICAVCCPPPSPRPYVHAPSVLGVKTHASSCIAGTFNATSCWLYWLPAMLPPSPPQPSTCHALQPPHLETQSHQLLQKS